jgi:putative toxin-antitoxin system antitoxin component (TIGR02293 family)
MEVYIMPTAAKHKVPRKAQKSVAGSALAQTSDVAQRRTSHEKSHLSATSYENVGTTIPGRTGRGKPFNTSVGEIRAHFKTRPEDKIHIEVTHFRDVFRGGATGRIDLIKGGVYAKDVARIAQSMDRSKEQVSKTLGLAVSTVDRKAKANERLSPEQGERVVGLAKLIGQVQTMVEESGDPVGFDPAQWLARWLDRPMPALGGKCPSEYMDTAEGRELLSTMLHMTQSGAYA